MISMFYNHKGGVGKTTLCCHVAFRAIETGKVLTVLDYDRQHNTIEYLNAHNWSGDTTTEVGTVKVTTDVSEVNGDPHIIIDASPSYDVIESLEFVEIDNIFVPVDGRFSVAGYMTIIDELKNKNINSDIYIVRNKVLSEAKFSKSEQNELEKLDAKIFELPIPQHSVVRKAEMIGQPVWKVPYGIRSTTAQNLKFFAEWYLRRF